MKQKPDRVLIFACRLCCTAIVGSVERYYWIWALGHEMNVVGCRDIIILRVWRYFLFYAISETVNHF